MVKILKVITEIEKEIKSRPITDLRKKEIVNILTMKVGTDIYKRYLFSKFAGIEEGDIGKGWEIEKKIEKVLDTYIRNKPETALISYVYLSLKRFVFKEFVLKSNTFIKTEKGILKCPVCKYDEFLELINPLLGIYKCSHCEDIITSEVLDKDSDKYYQHKVFSLFTEEGIECRFCNKDIPITSLNMSEFWIDTDRAQLILSGIEAGIFPDKLMKEELKCPYCFKIFKIEEPNFKNLATSKRYKKFQHIPIQHITIIHDDKYIPPYQNIDAVKKSNILIDELIIKLDHIESTSFNKCLKRYLYLSQIYWIKKYWDYAPDYFYHKTDILGVDIHKTMFDMWLKLIETNLNELREFKDINGIEDLKWFCREPNFSGGPIDTFTTEVTENGRVKNNTNIVDLRSDKWNIRIAKILSLEKITNEQSILFDFSKKSLTTTWQDIILIQEKEISPGDIISIKAIMMPGHPSHAPIRALLRVRSDILSSITDRVIKEEDSKRDINFWKFRKIRVKTARDSTKIDIKV